MVGSTTGKIGFFLGASLFGVAMVLLGARQLGPHGGKRLSNDEAKALVARLHGDIELEKVSDKRRAERQAARAERSAHAQSAMNFLKKLVP